MTEVVPDECRSAPTLQEQARALGDPTRHEIFRHLAESDRPAGVVELTELVGVSHNSVRQHLTKLVAAGLVLERSAPAGRPGRPRLLYQVDPAAVSRWGTTGPYERLSLLLSEIIRTGDSAVEVGRRAGHRHHVDAGSTEEVINEVAEAMAREGFDPDVRRDGTDVEIVLRSCPFETTAVVDPETACALHLGIAEGVVDGTGFAAIEELVPNDPHLANCRLRLRFEVSSD